MNKSLLALILSYVITFGALFHPPKKQYKSLRGYQPKHLKKRKTK